ncbi:hypothetical protein BLNAU_18315 [Blattamonas nauphoetae]|uniref:Uncharacterized protein n=1 Tax=Blattamonas nauphoetae TaxID=2049346 RepID=A0ABQ9X523_9EUKA|nr:hypothetical protein BLNAU_18315 [Blattamonas nauphoetae]
MKVKLRAPIAPSSVSGLSHTETFIAPPKCGSSAVDWETSLVVCKAFPSVKPFTTGLVSQINAMESSAKASSRSEPTRIPLPSSSLSLSLSQNQCDGEQCEGFKPQRANSHPTPIFISLSLSLSLSQNQCDGEQCEGFKPQRANSHPTPIFLSLYSPVHNLPPIMTVTRDWYAPVATATPLFGNSLL